MTDLPDGRDGQDPGGERSRPQAGRVRPQARRDRPEAEGDRPQAQRDVFVLDPLIGPERWEALVARINERAEPILEARRYRSLAGTLAGWRRPVLSGVAGLAAAAVAVLLLLPAEEGTPVETMFAEAMMPWSVAGWVDGSYAPTVEELVIAAEEEYAP